MIKFPLKFEAYSESDSNIKSTWNCKSNAKTPILSTIPVEFSGNATGYNAEELFALSLINCIIGEIKYNCDKQNESFKSINGRAIFMK